MGGRRHAASGSAFTPAFAAPEVRAGKRATPKSDLYSLGALGWALACGAPPAQQTANLRSLAPWVPPSLSSVIEQLLAAHPGDRPASAEAVLSQLGLAALPDAQRAAPASIGREQELTELSRPALGVRYLSGASGSGKSHLLREVVTRALLGGRVVRRLAFPCDDQQVVARLIGYFRGTAAAWPFLEQPASNPHPLLLALDDLHHAPAELVAALDAYRCQNGHAPLDVLATLRDAPDGAPGVVLGGLSEEAFVSLCRQMGVDEPREIAALARMTERSPGFAVAARGRVPLTPDAILSRTRTLSRSAVELLACLALVGGVANESLAYAACSAPGGVLPNALSELLSAALVTRRSSSSGGHVTYALHVSELAPELAGALGSFELAEQLSTLLLTDPSVTPRALLALAGAPFPPQARPALLRRAADCAEREGLVSDETDALFALAADPTHRSRALVVRLERLTRQAGVNHPQVMVWLAELAEREPSLLPLLRRRQAEQAARAGDAELAEARAVEALAAARALGDRAAEGLALATRGAVALYRADVAAAESALGEAASVLAQLDVGDPEELARLEHNRGVVALYGDRVDDAIGAFERSLSIKRTLGDRAGVRSCLLNLGLALARCAQFPRAAAVLDEAIALARALRQPAGRAWCLAARADVEVRRGDARAAEHFLAEAEAIVEAPPVVRADLAILSGQAALLAGDAQRALAAVASVDQQLRERDAMLHARARVLEAGALLASVPAEPRKAARMCVRIARDARLARLPELESQALDLLRAARRQRSAKARPRYPQPMDDGGAELWSWLAELACSETGDAAALPLLRVLRRLTGAERALLAACNAQGDPVRAWGVDLDGFELASPLERCDAEALQGALRAQGPLYQRDVAMLQGNGARLTLVQPTVDDAHAVLMLEHRFRPGAFDAVSAEQAARFATLAALVVRVAAAPTEPSAALAARPGQRPSALTHAERGETTVLPLREPSRVFPGIIGSSKALRLALSKLDAAIGSDLPVLIVGETGTGKELFARALHELGPRARGPLLAINCAAVPDALFEAELFGHARGAFTGADRARPGLLARAEGGTLLLDEIGELPLARQASLLRVLEARRYRPVGSDEERSLDVHVVAATNRSLELEVERGAFRQDLLFAINVLEVRVPALRERLDDLPLLVRAFIERAGSAMVLSPAAMHALESYSWPGNVRELEHHVQRLLALGLPRVDRSHLPRSLRHAPANAHAAGRSGLLTSPPASDPRAELERALALAQGNITHAARALGLTRHGLKKRMLRLGLRVPQKEGRAD